MKLGIVGYRYFNNIGIFIKELTKIENNYDITHIISGATGADTLAEKYAKHLKSQSQFIIQIGTNSAELSAQYVMNL